MFEFGSRSFARPVPLLPDRRCSWRRVVETGAWQCWRMQQESRTSWTTAIQNPNEAWRNPLLSLPPRYWHYTKRITVRLDEAVMVGPESSTIWNCEYLTETVKPFFLASSCVSFLRKLPSLSVFDKSPFCSCKKVWTCGIFSPLRTKCLEPHHHFDGRCAAHFLKAQATMCHPGNVPSKIAGFTLPHLDITKDGWLPSFKPLGMFKTLPIKDDIRIEMMENPVLFRGFLLGFGTSIYQRATCLPCWWNQSSSRLGSGLSGAPPSKKICIHSSLTLLLYSSIT